MPLISLPYIFSSGTTIVASQTNSNNTTFLSLLNGGLDNANLTGSAGITYSNLSLSSSIVNSDISSSAAIANSKLNLAAIAQAITFNGNTLIGAAHQGDILYDSGTTLTRLTPGTNGQFLQTQGGSANPQWATSVTPSNVVYCWTGNTDNKSFVVASNFSGGGLATYSYLADISNSNSPIILLRSKFTKILGINTLTVYVDSWQSGSNGQVDVNVGVQNGNTGNNITATTPGTWYNFTIDVSGLSNGTVYDLTVSSSTPSSSGAAFCYVGSVIIFGS